MPSPANPPSAPRGRREQAAERPIASALALSDAHLGLIQRSHERSAALGLSRIGRPDHAPLGRSDLTVARDRNQRLHAHAAPVMEMLFDQIVGTQSMVVLCDATGTIIHSVGDDDFLARASKVALQPGVNWSEQAKGTNAIGTALVEETPTLVHADEHYMHANQFLTCSAAPILDPRGNILGALDVTGDHRSYHQHTMALVKMSARMIENHWLSDDFRHAMRLHFHARLDYLGTLMEGILAVSPDGRIVGANRSALDQLGLSAAALRMNGLSALFGTTVGALVDRFRSPLATPMTVHTGQGQAFHLHARFNWPVWSQVTEAAAGTRPDAVEMAGPAPSPSASPIAPPTPLPTAALPSPSSGIGPGAGPGTRPGTGPLTWPGLADLLTGDERVEALVAKLQRVLDREIPILILGETGSGRDTLARAVHRDSPRCGASFVPLACAGIGDDELQRHWRLAAAGTLFLDGVGDLPLPAQARLMRLLQEAPAPAIVCASTSPLRDFVAAGTFREDLVYRLNGLAVQLPALRERSDLAALARRMLDGLGGGGGSGGRGGVGSVAPVLSPEVLSLLQASRWPGNLRQLFNVLRAAALIAGSEGVIRVEHLPDNVLAEAALPTGDGPVAISLEALEIDAIRRAVASAGGNISEAAKRLGVSRNTIYRKLRGA